MSQLSNHDDDFHDHQHGLADQFGGDVSEWQEAFERWLRYDLPPDADDLDAAEEDERKIHEFIEAIDREHARTMP